MALPFREVSAAWCLIAAILSLAGCELLTGSPSATPLNTHAIAVLVEQQDLAVRNARAFQQAHVGEEDATLLREVQARYEAAAAAYRRFAKIAAEFTGGGDRANREAIERCAADAALRSKEFNTLALQNVDPEQRPRGTGAVALATPEQLAEIGRDAWRSSGGGRSRADRVAFANGMRAAAEWPDWSALR